MRGPLIIHVRMDINEYYGKLLAEGCSLGHAQWIVGNRLLTGRGVDMDLDEAEKWFTMAWDNHFPGTANTEAFLLRRWWSAFIKASYSNAKRLQRILGEAELAASESDAYITLKVDNDAQAAWLKTKFDVIIESFRDYTSGRFLNISIKIR